MGARLRHVLVSGSYSSTVLSTRCATVGWIAGLVAPGAVVAPPITYILPLTVAATAFDAAEMQTFRTDLASNLRRYLRRSLEVGKMLEGATMVGKVFSSGLLNNTYRVPVTDGALLLGDAGLHVDPLFGQGHSMALMSASIVGELAHEWFSSGCGNSIPESTLSEFTRRRDTELMPYYKASVRASQVLGLDQGSHYAHRAASREQWAADEMIGFAQMLTPRAAFPTFRFARLMATAARAA